MTRSKEMRGVMCDICIYVEFVSNKIAMKCRRYPPTFKAKSGNAYWPHVKPDDWCGEFKQCEDSINRDGNNETN